MIRPAVGPRVPPRPNGWDAACLGRSGTCGSMRLHGMDREGNVVEAERAPAGRRSTGRLAEQALAHVNHMATRTCCL